MSEHMTGCQCTWCEQRITLSDQGKLSAAQVEELRSQMSTIATKYGSGDIFLTRRVEPEDATWAQSPPEPPATPESVVAALAEYDYRRLAWNPPSVPDIPAGACPECRTPGTGPGRLYCMYCDELRQMQAANPPSGGKPPRKQKIQAVPWFALATTGLCWLAAGFLLARPWIAGAGAFLFLFATRFLTWTLQ